MTDYDDLEQLESLRAQGEEISNHIIEAENKLSELRKEVIDAQTWLRELKIKKSDRDEAIRIKKLRIRETPK